MTVSGVYCLNSPGWTGNLGRLVFCHETKYLNFLYFSMLVLQLFQTSLFLEWDPCFTFSSSWNLGQIVFNRKFTAIIRRRKIEKKNCSFEMTVIAHRPCAPILFTYTYTIFIFTTNIPKKKEFNISQRITFYFKLVRRRWYELVYSGKKKLGPS